MNNLPLSRCVYYSPRPAYERNCIIAQPRNTVHDIIFNFLDPEGSLRPTTVVLLLVFLVLVVVTRFRKMPKALLTRNGKLRNFAHTFVTSFPTGPS